MEFSFGNAISYLPNPKEGYGEEAQTQTLGFENMHLLQTLKTSFLEQPVQQDISSLGEFTFWQKLEFYIVQLTYGANHLCIQYSW